jgi:hypothetical protein
MNLYYPPNSTSKACLVLDSLKHYHNSQVITDQSYRPGTGVFWGLANNNFNNIREHQKHNQPWIFTDMPYWGRWMPEADNTNAYWRIIPNALHCNWIRNFDNTRTKKLGLELKDWRTKGEYILVCPSSPTMERFLGEENWLQRTLLELNKHTDRLIVVRQKPRNNTTSGPAAATVSLDHDFSRAYAVVTLTSIVGVEAICAGIPSFTHVSSPAAPVSNFNLSDIENPRRIDRQAWVNTLANYQYTTDEIRRGEHVHIL